MKVANFGDAKAPIVFQGYRDKPGDTPDPRYRPGDDLDANVLPVLVGCDGKGVAMQDTVEGPLNPDGSPIVQICRKNTFVDCAAEPQPNDGRINPGAYGGTAEASKSPARGG